MSGVSYPVGEGPLLVCCEEVPLYSAALFGEGRAESPTPHRACEATGNVSDSPPGSGEGERKMTHGSSYRPPISVPGVSQAIPLSLR